MSLAEWKRFQAEQLRKIGKIKNGQRMPNDISVFCSDIGGYTNVSNYGDWWRSWRESNGFSGLKFHELSHTQATVLLANSVDVKTVQTRLGHANASITLNLYAHAVPQNDRAAADLVGNLFFPDEGQKEEAPLKKAV